MTELLTKLAEDAEWFKPVSLPSNWDEEDYIVSPEQMRKFAELIVRECSTLAFDGPNGILEHFGLGVEE